MSKLRIIGIGYRPLTDLCRGALLDSDVILASDRLNEVFMRYEEFRLVEKKIRVINNVNLTIDYIRENLDRYSIVLLASGDPLFFGIGRMALAEFGSDNVEIIPDLSSMQLAFAAVKETWDDAFLLSLHGGPDPKRRRKLKFDLSDLPVLIRKHRKLGILTDRQNSPSAIAKVIEGPNAEGVRIFVCERLGYPDERVISGTPSEIKNLTFNDPNVVIVRNYREDDGSHLVTGFGLTEQDIAHSRGLITKDEVRAVSIHKLRLPRTGIMWDIGAGSGAISIEAALINPGLKVYSVEKNNEEVKNIRQNINRFGVCNIDVIEGEAPGVLQDLPRPDRVFIGGGGDGLPQIIGAVMEKMEKGMIVINAVSLDTLNKAMEIMTETGLDPEVSQISVSRSKIVAGKRHMSALNPIFVIKAEKR